MEACLLLWVGSHWDTTVIRVAAAAENSGHFRAKTRDVDRPVRRNSNLADQIHPGWSRSQ